MSRREARHHIGTSGFSYEKWLGRFYPADIDRRHILTYYARHFDTVEINRSFYSLPREPTIRKWLAEVPRSFILCPKVSRYITHNKKLLDSAPHVARFLDVVEALDGQKGPALLQLPPNLKPQYDRLDATLRAFREQSDGQRWKVAVECRRDDWYGPQLDAVIDRHNATLVVHDMLAGRNERPNPGAAFVYVRFHGPKGDYHGAYGRDGLRTPARRIRGWLNDGKTVFAFFNNDADGHAPFDAILLKELLDR